MIQLCSCRCHFHMDTVHTHQHLQGETNCRWELVFPGMGDVLYVHNCSILNFGPLFHLSHFVVMVQIFTASQYTEKNTT